jgi:hypothetical protein
VIRNNIFAFAKEYQVQYTRVEEHRSFSFLNNIVYYDSGVLLAGPWKKGRVAMSGNVYWRAGGKPVEVLGMPFEAWQSLGKDQGSVVADPLFRDPSGFDFTFRNASVVERAGFKPFDSARAGVYGDPAWIALAERQE